MQIYQHRQIGTVVLLALGFAAVAVTAILAAIPSGPALMVDGPVLLILLLCLFLFWSLNTEVTTDRLKVWFGSGIIRKEFRIEDIRKARIVRNRWYYGWGIKRTPFGWMFNVSGLDAVELELKNNRSFRIGTDEPQQLLMALQRVLRHYA